MNPSSWFDVVAAARPYTREVSMMIPMLTAFLAVRIAWSARAQPDAAMRRLGLMSALGVVVSGFMFFKPSWGLLSFFTLFGFLTLALASSLPTNRRAIAVAPASALLGLGLFGLFSGHSLMLSLGPSMWPTAPKGFSVALMDFNAYESEPPQRGHDVNFSSPGEGDWPLGSYRKRVWGLPGDHIVIDRDIVSINGRQVADCRSRSSRLAANAWLCQATLSRSEFHEVVWSQENGQWFGRFEATVPSGHVFVMGDNTLESSDSRERGAVPIAWVAGRYVDNVRPPQSEWTPWTL